MRWDTFFGEDNVPELQWKALSDARSPTRKALQRFIDLIERGAPIAALPRVRTSPDRVDWYVGWRSESDARFAADLLAAFLGRTYAEISAPLRPLEPADEAEAAFAEEFEGRAFRVAVHPDHRKEARARLEALASCLLSRPHRRAGKVRPVGRILRDLEFAMQVGDDAAVAEEINVLRGGGHLDEVNLAFLELRRLAAKRDWAGIFAHSALPSVLELRSLPWRVRQLLVEAIYHRDLASFVGAGAVDAALARFQAVFPDFDVAFSSRKNLGGLEVDVCFTLADAVRGQGDVATDGALTRIAENGHVAFADALRAELARRTVGRRDADAAASPEVDAAPPVSVLELAQRALGGGDLDRAFALALEAPASPQRVKVLLQCARLLDDESAVVETLAAWEQLAPTERSSLLEYGWCKAHLGHLAAVVGKLTAAPQPTSSWLEWFERLHSKADWPGAVSRAEKGVAAWDVEAIAGNPDAIAIIIGVIEGTLEKWAAEALRQALPYVLEAFLRDPPDPRLSPIFTSLFDVLATDDALTLSAISALVRLGQARLSTTPSEYATTLDVIARAIDVADTPGTVRPIADTLEMLIMTPCASKGERTAAATRLASMASRRWVRIDEVDKDLVRQLCVELGVAEVLPVQTEARPPGEAGNEWAALAGRYIAFYSLETDALQRVVNALGRACPNAKLKTFSELGGTEPMREAAKTAELFVIATKSATHAATGAIMQHRRAGKATEYARSKSSTALLDAVRRWLAKRPSDDVHK
ncbi:protein DpdD [Polyangium sp. 6x1]|uniref:protein DpdD n=1 Tax=Polyangium sp. 6x1 TaxID=3042689 RepID=UPI002482A173|nr:protein DpdD [Polyangium sp. 6x1]MDI1450823.1 protein DpdD [Polyangium sp. 6x1]